MVKKYPKGLSHEEYQKLYMSVYYFTNREKLLAHARRIVTCEICSKDMPYSSYSYHLKHHREKETRLKTMRIDHGKFILNFD